MQKELQPEKKIQTTKQDYAAQMFDLTGKAQGQVETAINKTLEMANALGDKTQVQDESANNEASDD